MIPLIYPGYLGEHYQLLARGHKVFSCGIPVTTIDAAHLFSVITRELTIPVEQWRGVLMRLGTPVPHNFFHVYDIYHELVKLCQRGDLRLVKIPRLERLPAIATGNGWGYCFIRGPQSHPQDHSPVSFNSVQEAQNFVSSLNVGEKGLRLCTHRNPALAALLDRETDFNQRFIEGLANKEILAYKVRVGNSAPAVKPLEYMPATAVDREVPSVGPQSSKPNDLSSNNNAELAKGIGNSPKQKAARRKIAYEFYENQGLPKSKINSHLLGIDFSRPVEVVSLTKGKIVNQYQIPLGHQGNYYCELGVEPSKLGIADIALDRNTGEVVKKVANTYRINDVVEVLKSTAAKIEDFWSVPDQVIKTNGGEIQYFNTQSKKFTKIR